MRHKAAGKSLLEALAALRVARLRRSEQSINRRALQQPGGFLLQHGRRLDVLPRHMIDRSGAREIECRFVTAGNGEEVSAAHEFKRTFGGTFDRGLIDGGNSRAAIGRSEERR